jgi:hypothetical protein
MTTKQTIIPTLLCLTLLFLSCTKCCDILGPCIRYEVTGAAPGDVAVEFHDPFGDIVRYSSVRLPFELAFRVQYRDDESVGGNHPGNVFPAYILAAVNDRTGHLTVSIYVNGRLKQTAATSATNQQAEARYLVRL